MEKLFQCIENGMHTPTKTRNDMLAHLLLTINPQGIVEGLIELMIRRSVVCLLYLEFTLL